MWCEDDELDPDDFRVESLGSTYQLTEKPCKPNPHRIPLGFDLTPYGAPAAPPKAPRKRRRK